jgi:hypothetical protein
VRAYKYTDEQLLDEIRRLVEELGRLPKYKEMDKLGKFFGKTYAERFGSWTSAIEAAGLAPRKNNQAYTDKEVVEEIRRLYKENTKDLLMNRQDLFKGSKISEWVFHHRFGDIDGILRAAGLPSYKETKERLLCNQMLADYKRIAKELGRTPSRNDVKEHSKFKLGLYGLYFGKISDVARLAGLKPNKSPDRVSDEDLIQNLYQLKEKLGRNLKKKDMRIDKNNRYSINAYKRAFGSWNNALREAGLDINYERLVGGEEARQELRNSIINEIKEFAIALNRTPTLCEYFENKKTHGAFYRYFRSWNEVLGQLNLPLNHRQDITKEEVVEKVQNVVDKLGMVPAYEMFSLNSDISSNTVIKHIGASTWEEAMQKLGYDYKTTSPFHNPEPQIGLDGTKYRSKLEKMIANYMYKMQQDGIEIDYEYEKRVCEDRMWTCDFFVKTAKAEVWVEADGMGRSRENPYNKDNEKIKFYEELGLKYKVLNYEHSLGKFFNSII